jgi:prophage antirepressor-like protein
MQEKQNQNITFVYGDNLVRVVKDEKNGEPLWVAKDICECLDLKDINRSLSKLDEDEKGTQILSTLGGNQKMSVINESGLYNLIFRSNKPEAKKFKKWVTSEVLPTIRKTGSYGVKNQGVSEHILKQIVESNKETTQVLLGLTKVMFEMQKDIKTILENQIKQTSHIEYKSDFGVVTERDIIKRLNVNFTEFSILKILFTKKDYLEWKVLNGEKFYKLATYKIVELVPVRISQKTATRALKKLKDKKLLEIINKVDGNYIKINNIAVEILGGLL